MSQRALILRALIVSSRVMSMFGCVRYTPFIARDEQPSPEGSYLYGRFKVEKSSSRIGLVVKRLDEETKYCIKYTPEGLGAIRVEPGKYALDHYKFQVGGVRKLPVPDVFQEPFTVEKGKAYYIGDFKGVTKSKFIPLIIVDYWEHEWRADPVTYDYAGATEAFRREYPGFAQFPCEGAFSADSSPGSPRGTGTRRRRRPGGAACHFPQFVQPGFLPVGSRARSWPEPYSTDISTAAPEYAAAERNQPGRSVTLRARA